ERITEPADALLVTKCLCQRLAEHDRGVLDGVVSLDVHVPFGADGQVEARVAAEGGQHVVVERDSGVDVDVSRSVEVEFDDDVGLLRGALDTGAAVFGHDAPIELLLLASATGWAARLALAFRNASFSSGRPMVTRK